MLPLIQRLLAWWHLFFHDLHFKLLVLIHLLRWFCSMKQMSECHQSAEGVWNQRPSQDLNTDFFFFFNKTCDLKGSCTPDDSHWTQQQKLQRLLNTATTNTSYEDQQHQTVHVWWQVVADLELLKKPWVIVLLRPFPGGIWLTVPLIMVPVVRWPSLSSQASIWHDPSTLTVQAICHVSACC